MKSGSADQSWRDVPPIPRSDAERLRRSSSALGDLLTERFTKAFSRRVEEVLFERFPDGLAASLFVEGPSRIEHNVWAVATASTLADAGVDVHVVVRAAAERLEELAR